MSTKTVERGSIVFQRAFVILGTVALLVGAVMLVSTQLSATELKKNCVAGCSSAIYNQVSWNTIKITGDPVKGCPTLSFKQNPREYTVTAHQVAVVANGDIVAYTSCNIEVVKRHPWFR